MKNLSLIQSQISHLDRPKFIVVNVHPYQPLHAQAILEILIVMTISQSIAQELAWQVAQLQKENQ